MLPPVSEWLRRPRAPLVAALFILAASLPISRAAPPSKRLDLNTAPPTLPNEVIPGPGELTRVYGSVGIGNRGLPLGGGFDVDADGWHDSAFAQVRATPVAGRTEAGQVTVVFGDGTIGTDIDTATATNILLILGTHPYEVAGVEIWIDDVTGDGLGDIIIGRQNYTLNYGLPSQGARGAGAMTIIPGDPDLRTLGTLDLAAPPASIRMLTLLGANPYDRLGIWLRTGDIDGDGLSDIAVGADEVDEPGALVSENSGEVWVLRGGAHLDPSPGTPHVTIDLSDFGNTALEGNLARIIPPTGTTQNPIADEHFGCTVQVGDLDGNGRAEVIAGAGLNRASAGIKLTSPSPPSGTQEGSGGITPGGAVFIAWDENFPPHPWTAGYSFTVTQPVLGDFTRIDALAGGAGVPDNDYFGEEIITGEFSGDGFPDLYVGDLVGDVIGGEDNSGLGHLIYNAANLRGRSINLTTPPADVPFTMIYGPSAGAIGNDTVAVGDFDLDGIDELAVGSPDDDPQGRGDAGSVHVFFGQPGGWPSVVSQSVAGLPGPAVMRITQIDGKVAGDVLCYSAASGDIDQDGTIDFIVNEMVGDGFGGTPANVGNMLLISGDALVVPFAPKLSFSLAGPIEFGAQEIAAGATAPIEVGITNTSGGTVGITSLVLAGPQAAAFSIVSDTGEPSLSPAASRTVEIAFDPSLVARHGAALRILTNMDAHPIGIGLRGTGIGPNGAHPLVDYERIGNAACLRFPSKMGYTYVLRRSDDLQNWTTIQSGIVGTGAIVPLFDSPGPGGPRQYYQVVGTPLPTP